MGEVSAIVLAASQAAEEGGESSNFLIPNGTFFRCAGHLPGGARCHWHFRGAADLEGLAGT